MFKDKNYVYRCFVLVSSETYVACQATYVSECVCFQNISVNTSLQICCQIERLVCCKLYPDLTKTVAFLLVIVLSHEQPLRRQ